MVVELQVEHGLYHQQVSATHSVEREQSQRREKAIRFFRTAYATIKFRRFYLF